MKLMAENALSSSALDALVYASHSMSAPMYDDDARSSAREPAELLSIALLIIRCIERTVLISSIRVRTPLATSRRSSAVLGHG